MNARQAARKQANIKAAEERLARLKALQGQARKLRLTFGYVGTDNDVIARYQAAKATAQERFVNIALYACKSTSRIIVRYMSHSLRLPIDRQAYLIDEWLGRPQNKSHRAIVDAKMAEADANLVKLLKAAA
jgi:hypothetical protein